MQALPLPRRMRAGLFHVRSIFVIIAMTLGLALWMLVGVLAAGISALFEKKRANRRAVEHETEPHVWSLPAWLR